LTDQFWIGKFKREDKGNAAAASRPLNCVALNWVIENVPHLTASLRPKNKLVTLKFPFPLLELPLRRRGYGSPFGPIGALPASGNFGRRA